MSDFEERRQTEIEKGERCYQCKSYISSFGKAPGYKKLCQDCKYLDISNDRTPHSEIIRCPKCRHKISVYDSEWFSLYEEGSHEVDCDECDYEFSVETRIEYSFISPEIIKESASDDE